MMYILTGLISASLVFAVQTRCDAASHDSKKNSATGVIRHGDETLDSLKGNGRVKLAGTRVTGRVEVNGSIYANKAKLGSLNVGGHAHLHKTFVAGKSRVHGFFAAEKSVFKDTLVVKGKKISLKDCKVRSIFVKKISVPFASQVVELSKNSVCAGKIVFESGKGKVILLGKSKVLGKVKGAKVEKG